MTTKQQLQQLRISAISRLKHICVDIAVARANGAANKDKMSLLHLKLQRVGMDKLISKIDNAIRKEEYYKYDELYTKYKES